MAVTAEQYRAYTPRPFTRAERNDVTLLFGGLSWRAERLLEAALANVGYRARALPPATKEDLLAGRELADIGQCCPTSFTTGNLVNFLKGEAQRQGPEEVLTKYVYITAGTSPRRRRLRVRRHHASSRRLHSSSRLRPRPGKEVSFPESFPPGLLKTFPPPWRAGD